MKDGEVKSYKNGGPAFPTRSIDEYFHGMSLRDYFAGQAMVGTCIAHVLVIVNSGKIPPQLSSDAASRANYEIADAMLKEREEKS